MVNQQITFLPGIGDLLKRTWQIYKERFWVFLGIMILPLLVGLLLLIPVLLLVKLIPSLAIILSLFIIIGVMIGNLWAIVALLYAIKDREEKIGMKESFIRGWSKIISYLWISILVSIITLGGVLLFIIPGIIFSVWFSLAVYVLIAENLTGTNALFRSKQLVSGFWWKVFWRFLAIGAIGLIIHLLFTFISVFASIAGLTNIPALADISRIIFSFLFTPFVTAYTFLVYEDLRKIKAGVIFETPKRGTKIKFILIGIIGLLFIPMILGSIVLVSLGQAKERVKEARVINDMHQIRANATIIYLQAGNDYSGVSCAHSDLAPFCQSIKDQIGIEPTIHSSLTAYCAYVKLPRGDYYCIDSENFAQRTNVFPGGKGYCNGITFICPPPEFLLLNRIK